MFERLRDALRAALDAATPPGDLRDLARQMREAVVEARVAVVEPRQRAVKPGRGVVEPGGKGPLHGAPRRRLAQQVERGGAPVRHDLLDGHDHPNPLPRNITERICRSHA